MIQPPPPSDGKGHSYDLSSLAMDNNNWVVESTTPGSSATQQRFYINMCRSLVLQRGEFDLGPVFGRVPSYVFHSCTVHDRIHDNGLAGLFNIQINPLFVCL